jgi:hypothetical protein
LWLCSRVAQARRGSAIGTGPSIHRYRQGGPRVCENHVSSGATRQSSGKRGSVGSRGGGDPAKRRHRLPPPLDLEAPLQHPMHAPSSRHNWHPSKLLPFSIASPGEGDDRGPTRMCRRRSGQSVQTKTGRSRALGWDVLQGLRAQNREWQAEGMAERMAADGNRRAANPSQARGPQPLWTWEMVVQDSAVLSHPPSAVDRAVRRRSECSDEIPSPRPGSRGSDEVLSTSSLA